MHPRMALFPMTCELDPLMLAQADTSGIDA
jgi:hypothetical protein